MKIGAKIGLFLGSYSPLFLLLGLLEWKNGLLSSFQVFGVTIQYLPIVFFALTAVGIASIMIILSIAKTASPFFVTPKLVEKNSQETLSYLITYLIPFIGFKFLDAYGAVANLILIVIIGFLYIQSNMIYLNPVLSILGYKIYKLTIGDTEKLMLAKSNIKNNTKLKVISISEGIYIESK